MEITCDMAMDLAELYLSGAASEDSANAVKAHLKNCAECRRFYEDCKKSLKNEQKSGERDFSLLGINEERISEEAVRLSERIRKRRMLTQIVNSTFLAAGAAMLAAGIITAISSKNSHGEA